METPSLKVLVVDDEPSVVHALSVLFDLHEIPCASAASPGEALGRMAARDIGVVIQDMNFGEDRTSGEEGIRLFRAIREKDPEMPVLLITAWASLETAVRLVKEGASDYIAKPWDDDKLVTTVRNLLKMRALQIENAELQQQGRMARQALAERYELQGLVFESEAMHRVLSLALNVAGSDAPVLITGPSGSGKEKLAEIIQANSRRRDGPFIRLNVGALPRELMEAELFGAEPGAYTGARSLRVGRFEAADGGTLFLDEIDALPLEGQVKLLRVLQSGEFERLGSSRTRRSDVRVLSATNSDLRREVAADRFREDLFYRLNVIELEVPPLSRRREEILPLARLFLKESGKECGRPLELSDDAARALVAHAWGGNVRELQNRIRRAALTCAGSAIGPADLDLVPGGAAGRASAQEAGIPGPLPGAPEPLSAAETEERVRVEGALTDAEGNVSRAAEILGLSRQALYRKMDRLGIVLERRPRS